MISLINNKLIQLFYSMRERQHLCTLVNVVCGPQMILQSRISHILLKVIKATLVELVSVSTVIIATTKLKVFLAR